MCRKYGKYGKYGLTPLEVGVPAEPESKHLKLGTYGTVTRSGPVSSDLYGQETKGHEMEMSDSESRQ